MYKSTCIFAKPRLTFHRNSILIWELIILQRATGDFTRNSIVNPPCRSSYVDEFINIGVYTFIPHTTREVSRPLIVTRYT